MLPICYKKEINDHHYCIYTFTADHRVTMEAIVDSVPYGLNYVGNWIWSKELCHVLVNWIVTTERVTFLTGDELTKISLFYESSLARMILE